MPLPARFVKPQKVLISQRLFATAQKPLISQGVFHVWPKPLYLQRVLGLTLYPHGSLRTNKRVAFTSEDEDGPTVGER